MPRFFEASNRCKEVANKLGVAKARIRKVDTNFEAPPPVRPKLIIICESPSNCEVDHGYPTVSSTGERIFTLLLKAGMLTLPDGYSSKYEYSTHYKLFAQQGIYITNLVRYQADINIKGKTSNKDSMVKRLWKLTKADIAEELKAIQVRYGQVPVLIACGYTFFPQVKCVVKMAMELGMRWLITVHPSRSADEQSTHYNPDNWDAIDRTQRTGLMNKVLEWQQNRK